MRKLLLTLCFLSALLLALATGKVKADDVHPYIVSNTTTCETRPDCSGAFEWTDCTQTIRWSDGHTTEYSYSTVGYYAVTPLIELPPCCCND